MMCAVLAISAAPTSAQWVRPGWGQPMWNRHQIHEFREHMLWRSVLGSLLGPRVPYYPGQPYPGLGMPFPPGYGYPPVMPPVMVPPPVVSYPPVVSHPQPPYLPGYSREECINFDFHQRPSADIKLRITRTAPADRKVLYQRALYTMKFDTDVPAKETADWVRQEIEHIPAN